MKTLLGFVLLSLFVLSGCSSYFKRKSCEKVNWYDHGYKIAMQGKRLTGDALYNDCQKVEAEVSHTDADVGFKAGMAKYCSPEGAMEQGRKGEVFSLKFCAVGENSKVRQAYMKGVRNFCQPSSAFPFAAKGGLYKNVCEKAEETAWMPEYRRGRKVFLQGEIRGKRDVISQLDDEVADFENERRDITHQISLLPRGQTVRTTRTYNSETKTYNTATNVEENEETRNRRRSLQWNLDGVARKIKGVRSRQKTVRGEIRSLEKEIRALN